METVVKKEPADGGEQGVRDMTSPPASLVKMEEGVEGRTSPALLSQWHDVKTIHMSRAVASVAPCQSLASGPTSPWRSGTAISLPPPPPLLGHSSSLPLTSIERGASPPPAALGAGVLRDTNQTTFEDKSDESDMEIGMRSPSPEQRSIFEECYRSKNAV